MLSAPFLAELTRHQLQERDGRWHLQFDFDSAALPQLLNQRLGRTVLLTNRMDWSAEQIVAGYSGQQVPISVVRSWTPSFGNGHSRPPKYSDA